MKIVSVLLICGALCFGCVGLENRDYSSADLLETVDDGIYREVPSPQRLPSILTHETTPDVFDTSPCICAWEIYFSNGLVCLGVVCSDTCDPAVVACREYVDACQPL